MEIFCKFSSETFQMNTPPSDYSFATLPAKLKSEHRIAIHFRNIFYNPNDDDNGDQIYLLQ